MMEQAHTATYPWAGVVTCAESGQQQTRRSGSSESKSTDAAAGNLTEQGEKLKEEMDSLIEEIDEVLEENAEEFVKNYVQRGGE
jgi:ubiquitin-like protein Pup